MQVKKYEAPTFQEALDAIKRDLGPEAIILQTKHRKGGFGLMSKTSVEVTVAVSDRSIQKKHYVDARVPQETKTSLPKLPAGRQAEFYDKFMDQAIDRVAQGTKDQVSLSSSKRSQKPSIAQSQAAAAAVATGMSNRAITARRYIDIEDEPKQSQLAPRSKKASLIPDSVMPAALEDELRALKRLVGELKDAQETQTGGSGAQALLHPSALGHPALQEAFEQLVVNGVDKRFAMKLIRQIHFELGDDGMRDPEVVLDHIASEIMNSTEVLSPLSGVNAGASQAGPYIISLVGPTGVGKTTTVAKIAAEAVLKRGLKVGLINLDFYKVAAFDQLLTYAKILNVPFRSAQSPQDLAAALQDFQSLDVIFIDTTGRSQKDSGSLKEMQELLSGVPRLNSYLVLAATTRDQELYDMANRFMMFKPQGLIMSKLDEATIYGSLYNLPRKVKLPLLYFTMGQRVPEDIEEASRERVASLVMDL